MTWGIIVAVVALAAAILVVGLRFTRRPTDSLGLIQQQLTALQDQLGRSLSDLSKGTTEGMDRLREGVDRRLNETGTNLQRSQENVGQRLESNTKLFGQLQERLVRLEETNKQIQTVGQEVAKLQEVLRAPKLRGNLGELFLEELLSQILPPSAYRMQHTFRSGETVDAVIHLAEGRLVPVDAKFPLENFQKSVAPNLPDPERVRFRKTFAQDFRKHVDSIAKKYIRPEEGTLDFALMYVPAENVYYESILKDDSFGEDSSISQYAIKKRVIPVSPNSFYAYLQAILLGLRGLQIESRARDVVAFLSHLRDDLKHLGEEITVLHKHLTNATSTLERGEKRLDKIQTRVIGMESTGAKAELTVEVAPPEITSAS